MSRTYSLIIFEDQVLKFQFFIRAVSPDFTAEALEKIYRYSEGVPRLVNTVCDNALIVGFTRETFAIDGDIVEEVISDLEGVCLPSADEAVRLESDSGLLREDIGHG